MQFEHTDKVRALIARLEAFFDEHIYPNEKAVSELVTKREGKARWEPIPLIEQLKPKARAAGLWNMFLPHSASGAGLTNLEYAPLCEVMGRVAWSRRSVQLLGARHRQHGDPRRATRRPRTSSAGSQPLLDGEIRSAFCMTEPAVASSDATNIETEIRRDGDDYVINGRKWWSSGAWRHALQGAHRDGQDRPDAPRNMRSSRRSSCRWIRRA